MRLQLKAALSKSASMSYEELVNFPGPCNDQFFQAVVDFVKNASNPLEQRVAVVQRFDEISSQNVDYMKSSDQQIVDNFLDDVWNHNIDINWNSFEWPKP